MIKTKAGAAEIIQTLKSGGFAAYLVGGCVRDSLLGQEPSEWDITTSARPEAVAKLFKKTIPTGLDYGTVTVILPDGQYEVTTFRSDEQYVDGRHPQNVKFTDDIHRDLSRRDFTINALAYDPESDQLIDDFGGQKDLAAKIIRAVGEPLARFSEDGLRPVRACRFAAKLEFAIEQKTFEAIPKTLGVVKKVAAERLHDELVKMLGAARPSIGFELMRKSGLLVIILPELAGAFGVDQPPQFHKYDVYWHSLYSCDAAPQDSVVLRLAALLHDIGKPACKVDLTFYNHDRVGAEMAETILKRLKFGRDDIDRVKNLIGNHMFDYTAEWSDSAVRRFLRRIGGVGNSADLFALRRADAEAMIKVNNGEYLRELQTRIDKIVEEENALDVKDLKVDGNDVMNALKIPPGPKVGQILNDLLEKVLDDPKLNERETLLRLIKAYA
ncbi:MAG: CCA tRNA nucleotidyltransferase [Candidatus Margulisbacteria bacterium]|nr:CCA tRNA nucleotidyltransferase [Candidatus Margulisiibacteriota bacterium]